MSVPRPGARESRHIAYFLSSLPAGAIQRMAINLAQVFGERGHRVDLVAAQADGRILDALPESVRTINLNAWSTRLPWVRRKRGRWLPASAPELAGYLRREAPDVILAGEHYANLAVLYASWLVQAPTRVVLSEANPLSLSCRHAGRIKPFLPTIVRRLYPRAQHIVAVSQSVADDLSVFARIPSEHITAIHNPVVTPTLLAQAEEPIDHPWLSPGTPAVVLGVGRFAAQKDFATLIRAFARIRRHRRARLLLLGEGKQRGELEALVKRLGLEEDVQMPGLVTNPLPYMARSAVFGLSSIYEGFGNVLVEALACGCPIVSTDCPGGPLEILDAGKYGRLVPMRDDAAFATALQAALDSPADGNRLRARAADFSADRIADQYLRVLFPSDRVGMAGHVGRESHR